jgi:hypothetical protein
MRGRTRLASSRWRRYQELRFAHRSLYGTDAAHKRNQNPVDFQDGLSGTITLTSGPVMISKLLTIDGPGVSVITVSGNKTQQIFNVPAPFTVTISGLTIANGSAGEGGAISNGGALTVTGCTFSGNSAGNGGGIANFGSLAITGSTFTGNSANSNGGHIGGGGIWNAATVILTNSILSGNSSITGGGGIANGFDGTLTITGSTFSNNSASGSFGGGGIWIQTGTLTLTGSTFSGNSTPSSGGGISNQSGNNVGIVNSTFYLNTAVTGAGISQTGSGTLTLTSTTLTKNFASSQGGAIFQTGGGKVVIRNAILAGNIAPSSPDAMGALSSQGHNLIGNSTGGSGYTGKDLVGTAASPIDPRLGPLQDNGGPTFTMALLPGSPAIDAGDNANAPPTDQRGLPRIVNGTIDIGAFEVQGAAVAQLVLSAPPSVPTGAPFDIMVQAEDSSGNIVTGYTGTVHFASSDTASGVVLPADYAFTASDQGQHTFSNQTTLVTAGSQMITVTDQNAGISGSATVIVNSSAPAVDHCKLTAPPSATAGSPFDITVMALDSNGNVVPSYTGTVAFSSTDPYPAMLPDNYTFTSSDQGMHTFSGGVTLFTGGSQMLTVQDTRSSASNTATINVLASTATRLVLAPPSSAIAGTPFEVAITALDPYGNVDTTYAGIVTLTSSDRYPQPFDYAFSAHDSGTHTFNLTLYTAGTQMLSAWDVGNGSIRGAAPVAVTAAPASQLLITAPSSVLAGAPFDVIVSALDPYGNTDTNYQGTIHFASSDSDPGVILPADYTFVPGDQGVHTFASAFTLVTAGPQTLTATDGANTAITGSAMVTVQAGGGASRRDPASSGPLIAPVGIIGSTGNVQPIQPFAAVDRLFASVSKK